MRKTITILFWIIATTSSTFAQSSVMDFYEADVRAMKSDNPNAIITIEKQDVYNGFVSYTIKGPYRTIHKQMAYFIANNGKRFVAMVTSNIEELSATDFRFYGLENNLLVPKEYPCDIVQVDDALAGRIPKSKSIWIKLPQYGTNIQFGEMQGPLGKDEKYSPICELQFDTDKGTFKLVKL